MLYKDLQQTFALDLGLLRNIFTPTQTSAEISIEGEGVHWNCTVANARRKAEIHCFYYDGRDQIGPEYYITFIEATAEEEVATGRTIDKEMCLKVVKDWIEGRTVDELYLDYTFVDEIKRKIIKFHSFLLASHKEIANCELIAGPSWGDSYDYELKKNERSVRHDGGYPGYSFNFSWDDEIVFYAFNTEMEPFRDLVRSWLIDEAPPSVLKGIYPWIEVYSIAAYYERGEGILGEFKESWDRVERFYERLSNRWPSLDSITMLVGTMRQKGYDERLRAGTSLYTLILSRSRRHGLRSDQASIMFFHDMDEQLIVKYGQTEFILNDATLNDTMLLIEELATQPIT